MKKQLIPIITFFIITIIISIWSIPYINSLSDAQVQQDFESFITSLGILGPLIIILIQIVQIIIAFIPGEPIEILAGALYGGTIGLLLCIIGCIFASTCIFFLTKHFGVPLINKLFKNNKPENYNFIHNSQKLETVVFILFLIPGTPKDMLTYVVGISPMKLSRFLIISNTARIPSIVTSTFLGSTIRQGEWKISIMIFLVTGIIGIMGIIFQDTIIEFLKKISIKIKKNLN